MACPLRQPEPFGYAQGWLSRKQEGGGPALHIKWVCNCIWETLA